MGAQGSQGSISIRPETVFGTINAGQFTGLNFTSEDLKFTIAKKESKTVRPDRQTAQVITVGADCSGGFDSEFQAVNVDSILPGSLWDTDWHKVGGISAVSKLTAGATGSNLNFSFALETGAGVGGKITFGSAVAHGIVKGQHIVVNAPNGNVANRGLMYVKDVVGQIVTVNKPLFTEVIQSQTEITGDYIRNGVTRQSFSIQRGHNDIAAFFVYLGAVPNVMTLTVESGNAVMFKQSFIALDEQTDTTSFSTPAASTALSTNPIMNPSVSVGEVSVDGVALTACLLQKINIVLDQKVEGKTGIGVLGFCDINGKSISITGGMTLYFNDLTYYNKYRNSNYFSLTVPMSDTLGNVYIIHLPKVQFLTALPNISDKDKDVDLACTFQAVVGDDGFSIQVTRALDSGIAFNDVVVA